MTAERLTRTEQELLSEAASAVVLQDGAAAFDSGQAKYSISGAYNKCWLHLLVRGTRCEIEVLTTTLCGRLAVLELKADDDIHLPPQGLDSWARVLWHHRRGEFPGFGHFGGRGLQPKNHRFFWQRQICTCIPQPTFFCATSRLRLTGNSWGLTNVDRGRETGFRKRPKDYSLPLAG